MRKSVLALTLTVVLSLNTLLAASVLASRAPGPPVTGAAIVQTAMQYLGYQYTTVGNSPSTGFSCIGLVSYVYQVNGIPLPDDLGGAMAYGPSVAFSDLLPGDVLFFQNTVWLGLSHTAIYLGGGRFIHAEWYNRGVVVSSFSGDPVDADYWTVHYLGATRPWAVAPPVSSAPASPPAGVAAQSSPDVSRPAAPAQPQLREGPRALVEASGLNVRVRPSLFGPIRRIATHGTKLVLLKQFRSWDWVQLPDGSYGWVMGTHVGDGSTSHAAGGTTSTALPLAQVSVSAVRVHVRPNVAAPVVAAAYQGQKLLVLNRWSRWLRVLMPDGTRGWMRTGFMNSGNRQATHGARHPGSTSPVRASGLHPTVTAGTRLRTRPGLKAPVLTLAAPGTRISILRTWRTWVYGRFPHGTTAWVSKTYVQS